MTVSHSRKRRMIGEEDEGAETEGKTQNVSDWIRTRTRRRQKLLTFPRRGELLGRGATQCPKIYNVFFMTIGY